MKRSILAIALALGAVGSAVAGTAPIYQNFGLITSYDQIDAVAFDNHGTFEPSMTSGDSVYGASPFIWDSQNTRYYTNSGVMAATLGFRFDYLAPRGQMYVHQPAQVFTNSGIIDGEDYSLTLASTVGNMYEGYGSYIIATAKNIGNSGTIMVGDGGLLQLNGQNMTLRNGAVMAGTLGTSATGGRGGYSTNEYENPPFVEDLYWGANTNRMDVTTLVSAGTIGWAPQTPAERVTWGATQTSGNTTVTTTTTISLPYAGSTDGFGAWVYTNVSGTNTYVNIVFVRTNGLDANTSLGVRFYKGTPEGRLVGTNYDNKAVEAVVGISVSVPDIVSGTYVPSSFYLIDSGAGETPTTLYTNMLERTFRPSCFEIATYLPYEYSSGTNGNTVFTPSLIYPGNTYTTNNVNYSFGAYGAQVGRNFQTSSGAIPYIYYDSTGQAYYDYSYYEVYTNSIAGLNDASNGTARVEINAGNLDLSNARIRTEGFLSINATNLIPPTAPVKIDAGAMNICFGSSNGFLSISNVLPSTYTRVCGDIYAWAANWTQMETNVSTNASATVTNSTDTNAVATNAVSTNYYKFHMLVVDYSLLANQTPTIEDLTLRASKSIYVQDTLRVIDSCVFDTENLTINGPVSFYETQANVGAANFPRLKNLLVETNGYFIADNMFAMGADTANGWTSITNHGELEGATLMIKAGAVENRGTIYSLVSGVYIDTRTLNLQTSPEYTLYIDPISGTIVSDYSRAIIRSGQNVDIHAGSLFAQGSTILAGNYAGGNMTLWVTNRLSDGVPGLPSSTPMLTNVWNALNGFRLPIKPATGDLFGTELITTITNNQWVDHQWAGEDRGASVAGFTNNVVIGRLVLDREAPGGGFHFSGVGARSAMYVDYLEFYGDALDDYKAGLSIDRNLTIYFAASNIDPSLLQSAYSNRLVWVPEFSGPNSTVEIPAHVGGQTTNILCNASLASSKTIDSNGNGKVNANDPFPLDGAVLMINVVGSGTISPSIGGRALIVGHSYSATAVPQPGYIFNGWSWQNANPAQVSDAKQANISFTMQSNLVLTANFIPDPAVLRVVINGNGTVAKVTTDRLVYGKTYTLTATPAPGNLFVGWSNGVVSTARTIQFVMRSNLVLNASFSTNNLPNYKGTFNGLFYVNNDGGIVNSNSVPSANIVSSSVSEVSSNNLALASSGYFKMTITETGVASGKLYMTDNASGYGFTATVGQDGKAQAVVKRSGKTSLALEFQINVGANNEISGRVVDSGKWNSVLLGDRVTYTKTSPAPMAGTYSVALLGSGVGGTGPLGDGYGMVTIDSVGQVTVKLSLPDGTSIGKSALIGKNGRWPLYATRSGKDSLFGWMMCDTNTATLSGKVSWIKQAGATSYYKSGFADTFDFVGSAYKVPATGTSGITLRSPVLVLNGDPDVAGSYALSFKPGTLTLVDQSGVISITLSPSKATFSGRVIGKSRASKSFSGVLLQEQNLGLGFFYSSGASGEARLQNNE